MEGVFSGFFLSSFCRSSNQAALSLPSSFFLVFLPAAGFIDFFSFFGLAPSVHRILKECRRRVFFFFLFFSPNDGIVWSGSGWKSSLGLSLLF